MTSLLSSFLAVITGFTAALVLVVTGRSKPLRYLFLAGFMVLAFSDVLGGGHLWPIWLAAGGAILAGLQREK
ncbi:hypothetical protein [Hyperthermus butylicus]|uniref:hypothetical protein n=1 Tax=Hyperthermus butylicus TaxID=54248 RepID=UPI00129AB0CC|nr:hypothetical protein [Hyperthermus butylicus]